MKTLTVTFRTDYPEELFGRLKNRKLECDLGFDGLCGDFEIGADDVPKKQVGVWIKVEESLPDVNQSVIVCWGNNIGNVGVATRYEEMVRGKKVRRWKIYGRLPWVTITHWMPLPAPPAVVGNSL